MTSMQKKLLIVGAGGHGRCIAEIALLTGTFSKVAFLDDTWQEGKFENPNIIGRIEHLALHQHSFSHVIIGIGNNSIREKLHTQMVAQGMKIATLLHPSAFISTTAQIGVGSVVFAGVVIGPDTRVGDSAIINCNSTVDHDGFIDDFAHLGVGVQLAGSSHIGRGAFLQAGSCASFNAFAEPYTVYAAGSILNSRA